MLKYLVFLLDDSSVPYCYYDSSKERKLMSLEIFKKGIKFSYLENLNIQLVYPSYKLPSDYASLINKIDCIKIAPYGSLNDANIEVFQSVSSFLGAELSSDQMYILRTSATDLENASVVFFVSACRVRRLSIVLSNIDTFSDAEIPLYRQFLNRGIEEAQRAFELNFVPQINCITDRMMLSVMNNCDAGESSITLAPDGNFYICPAFYFGGSNNIGNVQDGINIKSQYLYKLQTSPLCRTCDAFNCRRCVWLNQKQTGEICIPSHEQCVISHLERNASGTLAKRLCETNSRIGFHTIPDIDYLDPFENKNRKEIWTKELE